MKLFQRNKNSKEVKHIYTPVPKKIDSPGESTKFKAFRELVLTALTIGVQYCIAKVGNPIEKHKNLLLDNELKRKQLEEMEDTVEMAVILEVDEEKNSPIQQESSEEERNRLIEELVALEKELRLKHGTTIELREIEASPLVMGKVDKDTLDEWVSAFLAKTRSDR